ncbi:MAG: vitamin B12-dependent ribonucleotide reductase [Candidatus Nomurabacteria bacterium]|nr:MAG: vitamin B12-dependent ribonucleotide reductase [Candidatus Nomurabacteria bacterium]
MDTKQKGKRGLGLRWQRFFSRGNVQPFDEIQWERRTAAITDSKGKVVFEQKDVEVPNFWTQNATNIVVSKYFYGDNDKGQRETSIKQLIDRVTRTITDWGQADGYFATADDAQTFYDELTWLIVHQYMTFNSPVWFNCGVHRYDRGSGAGRWYWQKEKQEVGLAQDDYTHPQCSACFILSVEDSMDSILSLAKSEGMIFKFGSGAGSNLSPIRSSRERLSGGGTASGPVSFMKGFDSFAGVIKSGGKTRRAAKMVILNVEHPDVVEFIWSKAKEERKAWSLIDAGYDGAIDGEAYTSVYFQNANHSVRVTDEFMKAVESDGYWQTRAVKDDAVVDTYKARDVLRMISEATHQCGDPGLQYDTTINNWHTCLNTDRIHASNPCSEYMFLNDTACNLASINLMKFRTQDGRFDYTKYLHAIKVLITAMEIIVDNSSYPTERIAARSHLYRTLGIGYANLGALLMSLGLPYDSDEGRAYAAVITALLTGQAYAQSAEIAKEMGPFPDYETNKDSTLRVLRQHREAVDGITQSLIPSDMWEASRNVWDEAVTRGTQYGVRNAQVSVLAPTGTIAFMMDCDTTGIEPDIALVKYKKLVGGGYMKIINRTVPMALDRLGYTKEQVTAITDFIDSNDTIEGAPHVKKEDLAVFDCAFPAANGTRSIHHMGHLKMMGAAQPFISGAISKTVNMPADSTVEEIMDAYIQGWKLGLKALAIYRDGSKRTQPLNTSLTEDGKKQEKTAAAVVSPDPKPYRHRLPDERQSITHKFDIAGHEGYITVGLYPDGQPGELFITMSKEGSTLSGVMDAFATSISLNLQYGVPLKVLISKFTHSRFEPAGFTRNKQIPMVKSIMDYIFRWLALKFMTSKEAAEFHNADLTAQATSTAPVQKAEPVASAAPVAEKVQEKVEEKESATSGVQLELSTIKNQTDAPPCDFCGAIMVRNASCYKCLECGNTSGCS